MVEGARLESVYTRKGIEGSNPSVSAKAPETSVIIVSGFASLHVLPLILPLTDIEVENRFLIFKAHPINHKGTFVQLPGTTKGW
ncbi:MAG: hypothetical protein JWQ96_2443 [Segetibacter sp.]|nr:hypothetical protein [Segetibacter sp.]